MNSADQIAADHAAAGRYDEAIPLFEQSLARCLRTLGAEHPDTMTTRSNLGPEHPDTLMAQENVATAYMAAGRLDDAIVLHEQTLAKQWRLLGVQHPDVLSSSANLAFAYLSVGRLDDAVRLYEPTLVLCE